MKRKMNEIIGLLKRGDLGKIAEKAAVSGSLISNIIHGRRDIEGYPQVSKALMEYVKTREKELQEESKLLAVTSEVYSRLKIKPPTDEELLLRNLNAQKVARLNRDQLLYVIKEKRLKVKPKDYEDDDELSDAVIDALGLEKASGGFFD